MMNKRVQKRVEPAIIRIQLAMTIVTNPETYAFLSESLDSIRNAKTDREFLDIWAKVYDEMAV